MLTLFLSASVPSQARAERFRRHLNAAFEIEQAVISLARAIFARGGRLVFGGHPTISPLVAMVAGEYRKPRRAESGEESAPASVVIYQSEAFREHVEEATLLIYTLESTRIEWVPAIGDERFDPKLPRGQPQCPLSLEAMRRRMLTETEPHAMVCIGGMEGVLKEAELFNELYPGHPIYVLEATGGAAAELAATGGSRVKVVDVELLDDLARRRADAPPPRGSDDSPFPVPKRVGEEEGPVIPYPLIFQTLVAQLMEGRDRG
ncbi:SLOG domain-containing protein [Xanthobacter versatilis]|uniref:SLOG domain-containing protein n=1 Tax=Xanthobacter autotrophicus (strain ATCC BAA-1158 / Py2) TaxID=78245 RepID=UPI00372B0A01